MTSTTTMRIDEDVKREATSILSGMGLSLSAYCNMALCQLVIQRRIPFESLARAEEPNDVTRRAMAEAQAKAAGLIPDDSPRFSNADALIASLEA